MNEKLLVHSVVITPFYQNALIIADTQASEGVVVDPGGEVDSILKFLDEHALRCNEIWLTHSHLDHCGGVKRLKSKTGARLLAHEADAYLRKTVEEEARSFGLPDGIFENCPEPDTLLKDGMKLKVGRFTFEVIETPGHTPGHVAFYLPEEKLVISGDTLFRGTIGRSSLPGGNAEELIKSARDILCALPKDTTLLCGHGGNTTVEFELANNPFVTI